MSVTGSLTRASAGADRLLGRFSMYRLVLTVLLVAAGWAILGAATGQLFFSALGMLASLVVACAAVIAATAVCARLWRVRIHPESSAITALILFFLFWPSTSTLDLVALAVAGVAAGVSKFVLAWRGRHLLNPAVAGALVVGLTGLSATVWWAGSAWMLPVLAPGALLVLWRTRRLGFAAAYALPAWALTALALAGAGMGLGQAAWQGLAASPVVFLAGFMLSEPLTQPPRRHQRIPIAVVVSLLSVAPLLWHVTWMTPELALAVGNLAAFALGQRRGHTLRVARVSRRGALVEIAFAQPPGLRFAPGQYLELMAPHRADSRGMRRSLSIASAPGSGELLLMTRVPERASSFKRALAAVQPGDRLPVTGVAGDFLLPAQASRPLALIAGGIGITPYLSHLAHLAATGASRDVVLVHAVSDPAELVEPSQVGSARVVVVSPTRPGALPAGWQWHSGALLTGAVLATAVPDLAQRDVYVSGPPAMVGAVSTLARQAGSPRVRTDSFVGC